jgi:hypothetical protein
MTVVSKRQKPTARGLNIQALQPLIDTIGILQRPLAGHGALDDGKAVLEQVITEVSILHIRALGKQFS